MKSLNFRDIYEVKRAAYEPDQHLDVRCPQRSISALLKHGLIVEHGREPEDPCVCAFYILTDVGRTVAAENGIARTWADESVNA